MSIKVGDIVMCLERKALPLSVRGLEGAGYRPGLRFKVSTIENNDYYSNDLSDKVYFGAAGGDGVYSYAVVAVEDIKVGKIFNRIKREVS